MIKVDIVNSPQVQRVASIPKITKSSKNINTTKQANFKRSEIKSSQQVETTTKPTTKVDVNKVKSTYSSSKSYATVRKPATANNTQPKVKFDTYASYRKKKYAERIKTRFDLLG